MIILAISAIVAATMITWGAHLTPIFTSAALYGDQTFLQFEVPHHQRGHVAIYDITGLLFLVNKSGSKNFSTKCELPRCFAHTIVVSCAVDPVLAPHLEDIGFSIADIGFLFGVQAVIYGLWSPAAGCVPDMTYFLPATPMFLSKPSILVKSFADSCSSLYVVSFVNV